MEALVVQGVKPQALLNRPDLLPDLDIYMIAYQELKHDRHIGMAVGTIPWSSIHRWCEFHGITNVDDVAVMESHIRTLEAADHEIEEELNPKAGAQAR